MAELRNIYTAWQKNQGADAMAWVELGAAYRTGQLKAVRVPDSLTVAIEESSRGDYFVRSKIWNAGRVSYGLWFHQLPELDEELERSKGPPKEPVAPLPEWETSEGFRTLWKMGMNLND